MLTAIGLPPGGSSTVHIYTQTIHRTTQSKQYIEQHNNFGGCGPCPVLASSTLAFVLQLRKKRGKPSVRVADLELWMSGVAKYDVRRNQLQKKLAHRSANGTKVVLTLGEILNFSVWKEMRIVYWHIIFINEGILWPCERVKIWETWCHDAPIRPKSNESKQNGYKQSELPFN